MKEYIIPVIEVKKGSVVTQKVDAIICPTNSFGYMGSTVAFLIKEVGGEAIEEAAIELAPIQVGEAAMTTAGHLPATHIIHAPIMHDPASKTDLYSIECAMNASLELAEEKKLKSLAIPGIGTNASKIPKKDVAKTIINCIKNRKYEHVERIMYVDIDEDSVKIFEKELKNYKKE